MRKNCRATVNINIVCRIIVDVLCCGNLSIMISSIERTEMFDDLRSKITTEELDYQALMDGLRGYDRPRDKITDLLRQGAIIHIKKGIYVFGERYRRLPFSREVLT